MRFLKTKNLIYSKLQRLYKYFVHTNNEYYIDYTYNKHGLNCSKTLFFRPKMKLFAIKAVPLQQNGNLIARDIHQSNC